jgi:L-ascorbate metabolism protein UlaG (beta-lactamase superfamily)
MNITKYQHACLVVEKGGQRLIVDPGVWSADFVVPENVVAIVITHEHPDHLDPEKLKAIAETSPEAVVYAHETVLAKVDGLHTQAVSAGETVQAGEFPLRFTGGEHAVIYPSYPTFANLGVIIDDALYYPGDSYTLPGVAVHSLALPVSAPWMKISEAMDFLSEVKPMRVFPTHDAILSATGHELVDRMLSGTAESVNAKYERLPFGKEIEL